MEPQKPYKFLKKGSGCLASSNHGKTKYAEKRKHKLLMNKKKEKDNIMKTNIFMKRKIE